MKTLAEGVAWINGGWKKSPYAKVENGLLGIDVDNEWGFQCKDFANGYAAFMGIPFGGGNAIALWLQDQPGWEKVGNAQPGYVFVKDYVAPDGINYGHTGVVKRIVVGGFYSEDQNWFNSSLERGSPPAEVFHKIGDVKGFLKPKGVSGMTDKPLTGHDIGRLIFLAWGRDATAAEVSSYLAKLKSGARQPYELTWAIINDPQANAWIGKVPQLKVGEPATTPATQLKPGLYKV